MRHCGHRHRMGEFSASLKSYGIAVTKHVGAFIVTVNGESIGHFASYPLAVEWLAFTLWGGPWGELRGYA